MSRAANRTCATGGSATRFERALAVRRGLLQSSCFFSMVMQEPPPFPRIGIRLESDPDGKIFYVHEFVLHSSSRFYEGLVGFYTAQPQGGESANGRAAAQITIPEDCLTDARCALHYLRARHDALLLNCSTLIDRDMPQGA